MEETTKIIIQLLIAFFIAKTFGFLFLKIKQPVVIAEILAGIILGPYVLNWLQINNHEWTLTFEVIAEIGVILLLFSIGLETKISDMLKVGWKSFWTAFLGVVFPFIFGYFFMHLRGAPTIESLFMGAVMVATSVGITARILKDLKFLSADVSRIILGAAVIDDILGLIVLSILSGLAHKAVSIYSIGITLFMIILFILIFTVGGVQITKKYGYRIGKLQIKNAPLMVASIICFTFAVVANIMGLAAIVGAFMAGLVLAEIETKEEIQKQIDVINDLVVVFFFVIMGAKVNIKSFLNLDIFIAGLIISGLAILGKLVGCALPVIKMGLKKAVFVGVGMVPRGEVGIIIAAYALSNKIIPQDLYGVAIFMVVITTLLPPFFLNPMIKSIKKDEEK